MEEVLFLINLSAMCSVRHSENITPTAERKPEKGTPFGLISVGH